MKNAEMEIVKFGNEDVIATSACPYTYQHFLGSSGNTNSGVTGTYYKYTGNAWEGTSDFQAKGSFYYLNGSDATGVWYINNKDTKELPPIENREYSWKWYPCEHGTHDHISTN